MSAIRALKIVIFSRPSKPRKWIQIQENWAKNLGLYVNNRIDTYRIFLSFKENKALSEI